MSELNIILYFLTKNNYPVLNYNLSMSLLYILIYSRSINLKIDVDVLPSPKSLLKKCSHKICQPSGKIFVQPHRGFMKQSFYFRLAI